jgi:diketogulonate reductase-like aldo/keto reductase
MWKQVQKELQAFNGSLDTICDLTLDTLYGSMWGLNMRYMSLEQALVINKKGIISYSLQRINKLIDTPFFSFKEKPVLRCEVGYGTFGWKYDPDIIEYAIKHASVIDTAEGYGYGKVETELGKIFYKHYPTEVFTKVRRDHMSPSAMVSSVTRSVDKLMRIPHVQLHFPNNNYPNAVQGLADLRKVGIIKSIGLSNCSIDQIESAQHFLSEYSGDVISSVQMPFNVGNTRILKTFLPYCQKRGIVVLAYSPLGQKFKTIKTPILSGMAKKYACTEAQIALAWVLSFKGVIPIPNTNNMDHLKQNFEANDLVLSAEDVTMITDYYKYNE